MLFLTFFSLPNEVLCLQFESGTTRGQSGYDLTHCFQELLLLAAAKLLQWCPTLCDPIRQPTRLPCPWDSPGKNTGVGCHFLLHCMKVKSESEVAQSCPTLCDPIERGPHYQKEYSSSCQCYCPAKKPMSWFAVQKVPFLGWQQHFLIVCMYAFLWYYMERKRYK